MYKLSLELVQLEMHVYILNDVIIRRLITIIIVFPDEEITSGKVNALVMLGSLPYQQSYDLCDLLKDVNIPCPVKSGKINFEIKLKVPEYTPSVRLL